MYANIEKRNAYNREYIRDLRAWRKDRKRCTECGEQDAYTLNGRRLCYDCNEAKRRKTPTPEQRKAASERHKAMKEYRRENHLCTSCGAKLPNGYYPYVTCPKCRAKGRQAAEQWRLDKGIIPRCNREQLGLCARCGNHIEAGFVDEYGKKRKLCRACYDFTVSIAEKGRAAYKEKYGVAYGKVVAL